MNGHIFAQLTSESNRIAFLFPIHYNNSRIVCRWDHYSTVEPCNYNDMCRRGIVTVSYIILNSNDGGCWAACGNELVILDSEFQS